jgi:anti-sigma factor RsiW
MSPGSDHLGEAIQDLLDGRLGATARARAEAHLEKCAECRRELEALRWLKATVRDAARQPEPPDLAASIRQALDRQGLSPDASAPARRGAFPWRPALAFGGVLALVAAALLLWRGRTPHDLPSTVAKDFVDYERGRLPLELKTSEPRRLEEFFAGRAIGFETHVYDLAMMKFDVVGGRVQDLGGRPTAFFVYQGPGGKILICDMFRGTITELPRGAAIRRHNRIDFHVYQREGLTMVFWREGDVICVLTARGDPEEVIQLAFAKAVRIAALRPSPASDSADAPPL